MGIFKDIVKDDMENVIFNSNEFADEHTINGKAIKCIIDNDKLEDIKIKNANGIIKGNILIYISDKELEKAGVTPKAEMQIELDEELYTIESFNYDSNLYSIILRTYYD